MMTSNVARTRAGARCPADELIAVTARAADRDVDRNEEGATSGRHQNFLCCGLSAGLLTRTSDEILHGG
jgi:hypothetical protein